MTARNSIAAEIRKRLADVRSARLGVEIRSQVLLFLALALILALTGLLTELLLELSSFARTILAVSYLISLAVFASWFVLRPTLQFFGFLSAANDYSIARQVGDFFPAIRDRLLNLLQLHDEASAGTKYSPELIDASFADLAQDLQETDFLNSVDRSPLRHSRSLFLAAFMMVGLPSLFLPDSVGSAFYRLVHFTQDFSPPALVTFELIPGNSEVMKGENVSVFVRVHTNQLISGNPALLFRWRPEGQVKFEEMKLFPDSAGLAGTVLPAVRFSTEYYAEYLGEQSGRFLLTVVDRPVIRSLRVRLDYPAYSRLPSKMQDEFVGDVTALVGTRITVTGTASKPLASGALIIGSDSSGRLSIQGRQFSSRLFLLRDDSYLISLVDAEGLANADPVSYQLRAIPDEFPQVIIARPQQNLDITDAASVPLLLQIKDDFGFTKLRIGYRLAQSRYEPIAEDHRFFEISLSPASRPAEEIAHSWNVLPLKLAPEDVVEYFAEVFDNDAVHGPKSARTAFFYLRLPSLEEVFTDLDKGHKETMEDVAESVEEAKKLKEKIESIGEDLKKNKDPDWQQQKNMEETAKRYRELQEKMEDVREKLDALVQQMNDQRVLSPETLEKYLELQQMLEQIDSAELQNALQQLQQAMQNMNREQLQQALQKVNFSEEHFRESIERTMNLLKRIQIEQKLDEVKKRAQQILSEQQNLAEKTASDSSKDADLAKKQEDLARNMKNLLDATGDVERRMEEFFTEMPEEEIREAREALEQKQTAENMQKSARQLKAGEKGASRQLQMQIQRDLQTFSENLDQIQQQMLEAQQQHILNALRRATNDLLELSKKEEALKEGSKSAPANSSQLRQNAQEQLSVINDLGNVIDGLHELGKRSFVTTPEMGKAIGEAAARMQAAMRSLDVRSGSMASQEQGRAMGALNRAAMEVQNALQSMMQQAQGQGGGGLLGQLQSMAGQQMSINMRTGTEAAARLAAEQDALRKSLEQLRAEAQTNAERDRILGDLDRIASEMKEVVRNMEQNNVSQETIQKQERILSRLLDAARSTQERDFEKKRKAQTGTQFARKSPSELDPATLEGRNRLKEDLLKAIEQGYSKDYLDLIRKYFDELQKSRGN